MLRTSRKLNFVYEVKYFMSTYTCECFEKAQYSLVLVTLFCIQVHKMTQHL